MKSRKPKRRSRRGILLILLAVIVLLVGGYKAGRWLETRNAKPEARGDYEQRYAYEPTIEVDGVTYRQRKNVTSVLLMGVDQDSGTMVTGYRNGGQADFLQLVVIDNSEKKVTRLQIDRDTMTPITVLGVLGNKSGVRTSQICLSHGFGDGGAQSCELTVEAVSNLLLGVSIDEYIAMNLDGISVLNDAVGGVTVTLEDDFSALHPAMTQGTTLTLQGDQAEIFVRSRRSVGVGTNEARMARQQVYISQMTQQLGEKIHADKSNIGEIYDALEPYLTTGMSRGLLINTIWGIRDYEQLEMELAGDYQIGSDGFMEFHADEGAMQQTVLNLFYQKVE